ncbi:hypothetical protein JF710_21860 [Mycobacterium intracellulare]|uniref:hypothetical protein n=1 Tax=Mycobacterium intracellulare TaxID=1767 RepID=UPI001CDB057F|nr:hypothetical protein [Mycobacterium intracellulare]MCA2255830.1 hypothetical protein [Mycobacterium intracellulare]
MDREIVEGLRSAVAVMTAFVDQYDDEQDAPLANRIVNEYVSEVGVSRLVTGFVHLSIWLLNSIQQQTGTTMEATLQQVASEASRLLDGGQ